MPNNNLWVERYRPKTIDEYVFHDAKLRKAVDKWIAAKSIPQLLFSGVQGSGKTSLAFILIRTLETHRADLLVINASDERGIETFREKVKSFTLSLPVGDQKIVLLEEADALTPDAQKAMKRHMEEYSEQTRFILTCNNENKVIKELRSRVHTYQFKAPDRDAIAEQMVTVLAHEGVKFNLTDLDKYIAANYPDIRKILNTLEQNSHDGALDPIETAGTGAGDWKYGLVDLIAANDWREARKLVCQSVMPNEWEELYRFLYENINRSPKFKGEVWEEAIVTIAEHLYKNTIVADPEINAAAMFIRLGQL